MSKRALLFAAFLGTFAIAGCGVEASPEGHVENADVTQIPARTATVLVDTCLLDDWQRATLASPAAKKVISEVVMLCLVPRFDGGVAPSDPSAQASIAGFVQELKDDGYTVKLGVSFSDESGQRSDAVQTSMLLSDATWRAKVETNLVAMSSGVDGIDVDFEKLVSSARNDVTSFVQDLTTQLHAKGKKIAVYVAPSTHSPSDVEGGDAYDLAAYDGLVDKIRVTTLDYSDAANPGPTIDPGWAVDAVKFAQGSVHKTSLDISYPLYGADFGPLGIRGTSWIEARGIADEAGIGDFDRGPTGAPHISYSREDGAHQMWFDDSQSTTQALAAWDYDTLSSNVGVFYWGLGAEDPALWSEIARRLP
jgi:spore germination protein YaaH